MLWQKLWNFVGLTSDLKNHNDYIALNVGGRPVVVQNFHGELLAFSNVCTHRFSQIHANGKGNRSLTCPYHGWAYDCTGTPVNVARQTGFEHVLESEREHLKLERWLVDCCGSFVFVKREDDGVSLRDYLGATYDLTLQFVEGIGQEIYYFDTVIQANWKLFVENTLEGYHLPSVHGKTFGKYADVAEEEFISDPPHFHYTSIPVHAGQAILTLTEIAFDRAFHTNRYHHYVIFPALVFWSSKGVIQGISFVHPLEAEKTRIENYIFLCKVSEEQEQKIKEAGLMEPEALQFTRVVVEEDCAICEHVQQGIKTLKDNEAQKIGAFNQAEHQIYEFHQSYLKALGVLTA